MSENAKISEGVAKSSAQIAPRIRNFGKQELDWRESPREDSLGRVFPTRKDTTEHSVPNAGLPHGLSFLSISSGSRTYPDTAESGEAYDVEVSLCIKTIRSVSPTGESSE